MTRVVGMVSFSLSPAQSGERSREGALLSAGPLASSLLPSLLPHLVLPQGGGRSAAVRGCCATARHAVRSWAHRTGRRE